MTGLSRRNALRVVGAGGIGLAATVSTGQSVALARAIRTTEPGRPTAAAVEGGAHGSGFTLIGSNIRAVGPRRDPGDQAVLTGLVRLGTAGSPTGEFFAQSTVVTRRNLLTDSTGSMQSHTFVLPDGTILGSGMLSHQGTGTFAVTAGTGAYQGLSGSYTVDEDLDDFAAKATYTFMLASRKANL